MKTYNEDQLRKALEPVEDWYDLDGEEGPQMGLLELISDVANTLVNERAYVIELRNALLNIVKHQEIVGGSMAEMSTTSAIAKAALAIERGGAI